jgi:hypothetical protein
VPTDSAYRKRWKKCATQNGPLCSCVYAGWDHEHAGHDLPDGSPLVLLFGTDIAERDRDKPRKGVVPNTLKLLRNGAVGIIDWLDELLQ